MKILRCVIYLFICLSIYISIYLSVYISCQWKYIKIDLDKQNYALCHANIEVHFFLSIYLSNNDFIILSENCFLILQKLLFIFICTQTVETYENIYLSIYLSIYLFSKTRLKKKAGVFGRAAPNRKGSNGMKIKKPENPLDKVKIHQKYDPLKNYKSGLDTHIVCWFASKTTTGPKRYSPFLKKRLHQLSVYRGIDRKYIYCHSQVSELFSRDCTTALLLEL